MRRWSAWVIPTVLACAALAGCKDDPPPPPLPPPTSASTAVLPRKERAAEITARTAPAYGDSTVKRFRIELCYYGAWGLRVTRDAYLASLGGKAPTDKKLPSFGEFPDDSAASPAPSASASAAASGAPAASATLASAKASAGWSPPIPAPGRADVAALAVRLPFTRYLSSCTIANRQEGNRPEDATIDKALAELEPWAQALDREILAAQHYYATQGYKDDKFERGKKSHAELLKAFGELDSKLSAFRSAFTSWEAGLGPPTEKLDKNGELGWDALTKARAASAVVLADALDRDALKTVTDELAKSRDALAASGKDDPQAAFSQELGTTLGKLLDACAAAQRAAKDKSLPSGASYRVTELTAELCEANHRALGRYLRQTGQVRPVGALPTLRPRLGIINAPRPDLRLRNPPPGSGPQEPREPE